MSEIQLMKALVKNQPTEGYDYVEIPIPEPGAGDLLIRVERVSICGSDINLYKWNDVAKQIASLPFTPGHECVGTIAKLGPGADISPEYKIGAKICVENHYFCGKCYQCTHDQKHICQNMGQFGHGKKTIYGGFSQYTIVPARFAYVLRTSIRPEFACLLEPLGVAHQAVEEVDVKDDTVLITGCGPVGLLCIGVARCFGATKIIASDVVDSRLEIAKRLGANVVVNSQHENLMDVVLRETGNDGVGAVIEASGASSVVNACTTYVRKGGRVLMLGLPKQPIHIENPLPNFIFRSITLKTIHGRKIFHTWIESEKLISSGRLDVSPIISHELPMDRFREAHELLIAGEGCKILICPQMTSS